MPSTIIIKAKLDMTPGAVPTVVHRSQYDSDFTIIFELFARTGEFVIEQGTTARLRGTKSSGTGYSVPIPLDIAAKKVTITGDSQMTVAAGDNIFEVVLYVGDLEICSANFVLCVERAAMDMDTITDETVVPELERLDEYIEQAAEIAAREGAAYAESWAVGGTGKRPDEDTNNAKYWSDQAQGVVHGVNSFNGRNGSVVPVAGDYTTTTVTRNGDPVEDSLQEIEGDISALAGRMTSAEGDIGDLQTDLSGLTDRVDAAEDDIDSINNTTVPALQSDIDTINNTSIPNLQNNKVDRTSPTYILNMDAASTTIDGALIAKMQALGFSVASPLNIKNLLTLILNYMVPYTVTLTSTNSIATIHSSTRIKKVGRIIVAQIRIQPLNLTNVASGNNVIGQLSADSSAGRIFPHSVIYAPAVIYDGSSKFAAGTISVEIDGKVSFNKLSGTASVSNGYLMAAFSWTVNS